MFICGKRLLKAIFEQEKIQGKPSEGSRIIFLDGKKKYFNLCYNYVRLKQIFNTKKSVLVDKICFHFCTF